MAAPALDGLGHATQSVHGGASLGHATRPKKRRPARRRAPNGASSGHSEPLVTAGAAPSQPTPRAAPVSTPTPAAPAAVAPVAQDGEINPLTGLPAPAANLNRRPLGVKVPNFPFSARPQSGLSRADVVIEHEAEAYLTRFMAIFYGSDAPVLGPIRSLRRGKIDSLGPKDRLGQDLKN